MCDNLLRKGSIPQFCAFQNALTLEHQNLTRINSRYSTIMWGELEHSCYPHSTASRSRFTEYTIRWNETKLSGDLPHLAAYSVNQFGFGMWMAFQFAPSRRYRLLDLGMNKTKLFAFHYHTHQRQEW